MQPTSELCVAEKRTVCPVCYHAEWLKRNKMLIPIKNSNYCIYVYQVLLQDGQMILYPRKVPKYLFHIFLEVLFEYAISFINYKALQRKTWDRFDIQVKREEEIMIKYINFDELKLTIKSIKWFWKINYY
jgi:hypothetical protein